MDVQQEFATTMKTRLASEIGNLVISIIEAQTSRDVLLVQLEEVNKKLADKIVHND